MVNRRTLLACAAVFAMPRRAFAQPVRRRYRIGVLEAVPQAENAANLAALREGLRDLGYVEGENLVIEYRSADGHAERFPQLAGELVRLRVDVIVTRGTPAARAAKAATATVPVVIATMGNPDAIAGGFARPTGNVTGLTTFSTELMAKRIQLLKELVPNLVRLGVLHNMSNPASPPEWNEAQAAARALSLQTELFDVRNEGDLERAFDLAAQHRVDALVIGADGLLQAHRDTIVAAAAQRKLPVTYPARDFVEAGGLMSYAVNYPALYRRFATYVDRILKGAKPADLPVEQPAKFELVINVGTARALGLTVPASMLVLADAVIR
jgi:putative ABC transport system substrate-binding protein